jgi:hypothetical protein
MKRTSEIRAVDLVRQIRDVQAKELAGKSSAEIIEFFNRAAARAEKSHRRSKQASTKPERLSRR